MSTELQLKPAHPRWISVAFRWRRFCQQWRHSYLLLLLIFCWIWRVADSAIPVLDNTRFMGGLHPIDVLLLMSNLKLMWLPPLALAILYALSFGLKQLNTAAAIAVSALCSSVLLAWTLIWALFRIMGC